MALSIWVSQHNYVDVNLILKLQVDENTILDCGCGIGTWGLMIKQRYPYKTLIGVDLWRSYLFKARDIDEYASVFHGTITHLPFRDDTFDLCLAIEVIEHLNKADGYKFLDEAKRVCRTILLSTPADFMEPHSDLLTEQHLSLWCPDALRDVGFEIVKITYVNGFKDIVAKWCK